MRILRQLAAWRAYRDGLDFTGRSVGFVPTMGALHAGHRALLERARAENDRVVLSLFVNPRQFDQPEDLAHYPQTFAADEALAQGLADCILAPAAAEIYPDDYRFRVTEGDLSARWEGACRPGHFDGVLTVVLKLLNLVRPDRAYFGEKDWQQLQLVQGMVAALFLPCTIVPCPTVRDADGLALSSRNRRLGDADRRQAAAFPRILHASPDAAGAARALRQAGFEVDYVEDVGGERLGAVRLAGVRLIDHVPLPR